MISSAEPNEPISFKDTLNLSCSFLTEVALRLDLCGLEVSPLILTDLNLNMDDFVSFSDYFFDGFFFSDIMVQGRINDARSKLEDTLDVVERIRDELAEKLNQM